MTDPHVWWYVTRASAIVAWAVMTVAVLWGVLLSTRVLRSIDNPAWLHDLHRWLGGTALFMTALHMVSLVLDAWARFSLADVLLPFSASYRPLPVALGIVAFYLLVAVQGSSLLVHRMPRRFWKSLHYGSYVAVVLVAFHAGWSGTDVAAWGYRLVAIVLVILTTAAVMIRMLLPTKAPPEPLAATTAVGGRADRADRRTLTVTAVRRIASAVVAIDLAPADGTTVPAWTPGSHLTLHLPNGLERQYSLCGDPADRGRYRIAVQLAASSRGGSAWLHAHAVPGMALETSGPLNHFALEPCHDYLFIAGGIGITPIKSMIESLPAQRHWRLIYTGRSRSTMAFVDELLHRWPEQVSVYPRDEVRADLTHILSDSSGDVYCCGPESMTGDVAALVPAERLHVERFAPLARTSSGATRPVDVTCRRSGARVHVAADESVLDALEHARLPVFGSCREGVCGACEVRVIGGRPEHLDSVADDGKKDALGIMYPCVSRAQGNTLTLDI